MKHIFFNETIYLPSLIKATDQVKYTIQSRRTIRNDSFNRFDFKQVIIIDTIKDILVSDWFPN